MSVSLRGAFEIVGSFVQARRLGQLRTREQLLAHQQQRLEVLRETVMRKSPFYASWAAAPFESWPVMTKARWMASFNAINTVGVTLEEAAAVAERAESSRDFKPTLRGVTVGMSTGTSGSRGLFMVSPSERHRWAGTLLAKLVHERPWRPMRVALMLRANSGLYETLGAGPLRFQFFDLTRDFREVLRDVSSFDPTLLVAPAHVLSAVARAREAGEHRLQPQRIISVAEVLDSLDRQAIERAFGVQVEQIYQATEGFLGATCRHGALHLNEEYLIVEPEWVDASRTRFIPLITDLYRSSQPVIRYRLNDVLVPRTESCPCGSPALALERIEGREDDVLWLPPLRGSNPVPVFSDVISRVFVRTLPGLEDYSLDELETGDWRAGVRPMPDRQSADRLLAAIQATVAALGAQAPQVAIGEAHRPSSAKLRRVRSARFACPP